MPFVKTVKIDGEPIYIFNSALYLFESSKGVSLVLDIIVTEVTVKRYRNEEALIVDIELEDGRLFNLLMYLKVFQGGLPQLHLYCGIDDLDEYPGIDLVNENDSWFPNIEDGITLEDIRKVEMPDEDVSLKLRLPIDQVEWLKSMKKRELSELFKEWIYDQWKIRR